MDNSNVLRLKHKQRKITLILLRFKLKQRKITLISLRLKLKQRRSTKYVYNIHGV